MKFEIDPSELTTEQRTHVAAFITSWPTNTKVRLFDDSIATVKYDPVTNTATPITNEEFYITEEQRLDAEQKSDLREGDTTGELREISGAEEARELGAAQAVNLNAIFGTPDVAKIDNLVPLDKEGLPWDSRIHASTKTFIADGSWKLRRGVDPAEVATVKAQLKELMAVPVADSAGLLPQAPAPVFTATSVGYVPVPPAPVITPQLAEIVPPISGNVGVPPAPKSIDQAPTVTLTDLIGRMSKAIAENRLTQANVTEICVKHGVSEFHLLSNRPDLLPLIDADMKAMGV